MTNSETLLKLFDLRHGDLGRNFSRDVIEYEGEGVVAIAVYGENESECWRESATDLILWWIGGQIK